MKKVFLAFPGYNVKIREKIKKIEEFEFWNLEKITETDFIELIKNKIKPANKNVKKNYFSPGNEEFYKNSYKESTWGVLLPDYAKNDSSSRYESLFVKNLFSDLSLPVTFYVTRLGITVERQKIDAFKKSSFHSEDKKVTNKYFLQFYQLLLPEIIGTNWHAYEVLKWDREQWRLSIACLLFNDLEKYQRSKQIMHWQKECTEIVTLYEMLLSRFKNDTGRHKIIQRIEILLGKHYKSSFVNIKKNLHTLFDYRNEFVHGNFFDRLKKDTKSYSNNKQMAQLPMVDFNFLEEQTEVLRKTFIAFIYLKKKFKKNKSKALKDLSIPDIINLGIMDITTRKKIEKYSEEILKLAYFKK